MKVVFVADCLTTQRAGIHIYTRGLIPSIINAYPDHIYYHITSEPYHIDNSINIVIPIKSWLPGHYRLRYFIDIPRQVSKLAAQVVIETAHFGPFRMSRDVFRMTVVHDLTPILFPQFHDRLSVWWHRLFFGRLLQSVDGIISNSNTTKNDLKTHLNITSDKVSVCYPSLPTIDIKPNLPNSECVRFITVGTIEPRKNHEFILAALTRWYELAERDFEWIIVGGMGWKNSDFLNALEHSKIRSKVKLTGYVDEDQKQEAYQNAHVLLYASHYEGFGIPIVEAMQNQLVIFLSDTEIHREVGGSMSNYFNNIDHLVQLLEKVDLKKRTDHHIQLKRLRSNEVNLPILGKRRN